MKIRILNENLRRMIADETNDGGVTTETAFDALENWCDWTDDDGRMYYCEIIVSEDSRSMLGYWAHVDEVHVLKPSEELAALGHPNYSDDFAEEVLLYMVENDVPVHVAVTIINAKDLRTTDHYERSKPIPYRVQGGTTEL